MSHSDNSPQLHTTMRNSFASRGLAHRYRKKPPVITREEVNEAVSKYIKEGGTIKELPPEGQEIHRKLSGSHDARTYSWSFNAIRNTGIVNLEQEEFKY